MSDSQKDIELLAVRTSRDSARFNRIIDRLRQEAQGIAMAMGIDAESATEQAIQKATDWLRGDATFQVSRPWIYLKKLIHNAVVDYGRTHKGEVLSEEEVKALVTQIEGGSWDEEERNRRTEQGYGWRVIKVKKADLKAPVRFREYPEHPKLRALNSLIGLEGWLTYGWLAHNYLMDKSRGKGIKVSDRTVIRLLKSEQDWRWQRYKFIVALIENFESLREQEIMKHFLWGYRVMDIAAKLDVTKAYISRVVGKWLNCWGWDKYALKKARIVLLTFHLASDYLVCVKKAMPKVKGELIQEYQEYPYIRQSIEHSRELPTFIHLQLEERLEEKLYNKVMGAPETNSYFSGLSKSDAKGLLDLCEICHHWWYGNIEKLIYEGRL